MSETVKNLVKELLALDLTFENSDDHTRWKAGKAAATSYESRFRQLPEAVRRAVTEAALADPSISQNPAKRVAVYNILGVPAALRAPSENPVTASSAPSGTGVHSDPSETSTASSTELPGDGEPKQTANPSTVTRKRRSWWFSIRQLLARRRRPKTPASQADSRHLRRGGTHQISISGVYGAAFSALPSHASSRRDPNFTARLRDLVGDPVSNREELIVSLFHVASEPVAVHWAVTGRRAESVQWGDTSSIYRNRRPSTLGDKNISNTSLTLERKASNSWVLRLRDGVPLYREDDRVVMEVFGSEGAARARAAKFLHDRYRVVRPDLVDRLVAVRDSEAPLTQEEAHALVVDVVVALLGEDYRSPLYTQVGIWKGTLRALVDELSKVSPEEVELYLVLREGWTGNLRELRRTIRDLNKAGG